MSELVIGEAVVVEMRTTRPATRALGFGIDVLAQALLAVILMIPIALVAGHISDALLTALGGVVYVAVLVGYPTTFETLTRGKSLGKYAVGLRVVRDDGGPIRFRHALVRGLVGAFLDFWPSSGTVAFFTSLLNSRGKRLGDMLAGSVVVLERAPRETTPTPDMPPQLAGWAQQLELARLPAELAMAARSYLARYHELNAETRHAMGVNLAGQVVQYVAPQPPPGTPPWAYLAAVLAERRRRAMSDLPSGQMPGAPSAGSAPQQSGAAWQPPGAGRQQPGAEPDAGPGSSSSSGPVAGPDAGQPSGATTPRPNPPDQGGFAPPA